MNNRDTIHGPADSLIGVTGYSQQRTLKLISSASIISPGLLSDQVVTITWVPDFMVYSLVLFFSVTEFKEGLAHCPSLTLDVISLLSLHYFL